MAQLNMNDFAERSPLATRQGNAPLTLFGNKPFAAHYGATDEVSQLNRCGIIDLTNLARVGFRGVQTADYLIARGYVLPEAPNTATVQVSGEQVVRLSQTEYLLLGSIADAGERVAREESSWQLSEQANYLLPRQDSHAWLALTGEHIAQIMAKVCGVDLRASVFAPGDVAQTSIARVNGIVINASTDEIACFYLLCDRPSAHYLWGALLDAMQEFEGQPVGINALITALGLAK
ncbi:sarcosine oxidase [Pseudomonas luteola]|uniref:sarcosine oxidase subunit gamma n=1 Tax=Pseudomonas luteola TaxID=47886 RepID=UPI000F7B8A6E|nr:sarcosine oxidase [Pseudomonas luteola]RRW40624.1 sarcosine oxidase [Pseudomonas luteola]